MSVDFPSLEPSLPGKRRVARGQSALGLTLKLSWLPSLLFQWALHMSGPWFGLGSSHTRFLSFLFSACFPPVHELLEVGNQLTQKNVLIWKQLPFVFLGSLTLSGEKPFSFPPPLGSLLWDGESKRLVAGSVGKWVGG